MNWKFYTEPTHAWDAMYEACREAKKSIRIEEFIFKPDTVGKPLLKLLAAKAGEGIDVKIIADTLGSYGFYKDSSLLDELRRQGVQFEFYNPVKIWPLSAIKTIFFRDHRKLILIDGEIAFLGSLGLSDMFRSWRETVVRVEGGITEMLEKYFDDFWEHVQSGIPWMPLSGKPYGEFQFLYGIPIPRRRHLYYKLINSIEAAKKQIYLVTPYFVPNLRLLQVLRQSAKRGVEIKLIVSKRTDHPWIDRAAHFYFKPLINAGIKVYQYETRTIHVKMAACDNTVGFIGSQNLDNLSLFFNHEGSLVSTNPEFITQIQKQFTDDLGSCREIKLPEWDHRPMLDRLIELSTLPFHWWM